GGLLGAILLIIGLIRLNPVRRVTWLTAFVLPFIVSQILLGTVATDSPFVNAPARSMACAALLFTLVAVGLASVRRHWLQFVLIATIVISHAAALANYYRGINFINTVYNTPAREVAQA